MKNVIKHHLPTFSVVIVMFIFFSVFADSFLTWRNINSLLREVSIVGMVALGLTFVTLGGAIDLSTGAIVGMVMMWTARCMIEFNFPWPLAVLAGIALGIALGLFNLFFINTLGLGDFMVTWATGLVFQGFIYVISTRDSHGNIITAVVQNKAFKALGGIVGNVYISIFVWLALVAIGYFLLKKTKFGMYTYACGTNPVAAKLSGINVKKIRRIHFLISAFCCSVAGIFQLAWSGSANSTSGSSYTFDAIVIVVVGGTALSGGVGDTLGTAAGSIFMIMLLNGIYKFSGVSPQLQAIIKGSIILLVASFSAIKAMISANRKRRRLYLDQLEKKRGGN